MNRNKVSFGRVVISKQFRNIGLGSELVKQTLLEIQKVYGHPQVIIHSQYYARHFYHNLGLKIIGKPFKEAMRKHIKMIIQL